MMTRPLTPTEPIITAAEFATWVGVSDTDPLIDIMATSATDLIINYLEMELIDREREVIYKEWPTIGTDTRPTLSRNNMCALCLVDLPYSHTAVTDFVLLLNGEAETADLVEGKPFQFSYDEYLAYSDCDDNAIKATYTTGYGTIDDVPSAIKQAVLTLAAFMYEHRGECDANEMLSRSGAMGLVQSYKTNVVII